MSGEWTDGNFQSIYDIVHNRKDETCNTHLSLEQANLKRKLAKAR